MKITIEWHRDQFNVALTGSAADPFITIKGCRIANGKNGEFVSWPSRKLDTGKYWNHVYASEPFAAAVLAEAKKAMPQDTPRRASAQPDMDDIPF